MPVSQENVVVVQSARSDNSKHAHEDILSLVDNQVNETLKRLLPQMLTESLKGAGLAPSSSSISTERRDVDISEGIPEKKKKSNERCDDIISSARSSRFYSEPNHTSVSTDMLEFLTSAFTKRLSKAVWTELLDRYPAIEGMENVLVAPTMETGMKEDIKKKHGYYKTKESFSFDEGLADRQAPILMRPIVAALEALDFNPEEDDEESGPEPDDIKVMLEDALALLGNAIFRLNAWRQRRFSEYLTDLGKRTLKSDLPSDKHLFPDSFHKAVQSEHDHSQTNSKLVAAPVTDKSVSKKLFANKPPFRRQPFHGPPNERKRNWGNRWSNSKSFAKTKNINRCNNPGYHDKDKS